MREIAIDIAGLGFILYSPPAVSRIPRGQNYLIDQFSTAADIARHVNDCELTAFCTGTPGSFLLRFSEGPLDESAFQAAEFKLRLGLQVQEAIVCVRDLYDLMRWSDDCPAAQKLSFADGWYWLTVYSSCPKSGIFGDDQIIDIHFHPTIRKPELSAKGRSYFCD